MEQTIQPDTQPLQQTRSWCIVLKKDDKRNQLRKEQFRIYRGGDFSGICFAGNTGEESATKERFWMKSGPRAGRQEKLVESTIHPSSVAEGSHPLLAHTPLWLQPSSPLSASAVWPRAPSVQQGIFAQQSSTSAAPVQPEKSTAAPATDAPATSISNNKNRLRIRCN